MNKQKTHPSKRNSTEQRPGAGKQRSSAKTNALFKESKEDLPVYRLGWRRISLVQRGWIRTEFYTCQGKEEAHDLSGRATLKDGFLWLSSWKVRSCPSFATIAERDAHLASLPPWPLELAQWAVEVFDFGPGCLVDCRTGKEAAEDDPEAKAALQKVKELLEREQQQPIIPEDTEDLSAQDDELKQPTSPKRSPVVDIRDKIRPCSAARAVGSQDEDAEIAGPMPVSKPPHADESS